MSGYATKADAVTTVKLSIVKDSAGTGLSRDLADYNIAAIIREVVYSRGTPYGWSIEMDSAKFEASLRRNLRQYRRSEPRDCPAGCGAQLEADEPDGPCRECSSQASETAIGHWEEDPQHPVADWQYEVSNDDTRLGYRDWLTNQREAEE